MSQGFAPYPAYRDSGLPWLGQVPEHWDVRRNSRLFAERREMGFPDLPILEVSMRTGVRIRDFSECTRKQVMTDRSQYQRAVRGDIAYNMMRMWQGAVGVAPVDGLISPAYVVARPYEETESRFYAYLFRTAAYMAEVDKYSHGIVKDRNRLYWNEFKQMPSVFPPPQEQRAIANFLDAHGMLVARFIRNKQRLISILNEQRQAIITRYITRGVDAGVQVTSSGVHWLDDVPEHWKVIPLKQVAAMRFSTVDKHIIAGEIAVRLCNYTDVYRNDHITAGLDFMPGSADASELADFTLRDGDVLITKDSENWRDIAVSALVVGDLDEVLCGYHLALIRPLLDCLTGPFLHYLLSSPVFNYQFQIAATGVIRYGLSHHAIKNALIVVPPVVEQRDICAAIGTRLEPLRLAVEQALREMKLVQEYRTRLIADVVMGKLDVRHLAPSEAPPDAEALQDALEALEDAGLPADEDSSVAAGDE